MPIPLPAVEWPSELQEGGPPEDPTIVLSGSLAIGLAPHRVLAVRMNMRTLAVDYRDDVSEAAYAACQAEEMLQEMTFLEDIDRSVLVPLAGGSYVVWVVPFANQEG